MKKVPHIITINGVEQLAESKLAAMQHLKTIVKRATMNDVLRLGTDNMIKEQAQEPKQ